MSVFQQCNVYMCVSLYVVRACERMCVYVCVSLYVMRACEWMCVCEPVSHASMWLSVCVSLYRNWEKFHSWKIFILQHKYENIWNDYFQLQEIRIMTVSDSRWVLTVASLLLAHFIKGWVGGSHLCWPASLCGGRPFMHVQELLHTSADWLLCSTLFHPFLLWISAKICSGGRSSCSKWVH